MINAFAVPTQVLNAIARPYVSSTRSLCTQSRYTSQRCVHSHAYMLHRSVQSVRAIMLFDLLSHILKSRSPLTERLSRILLFFCLTTSCWRTDLKPVCEQLSSWPLLSSAFFIINNRQGRSVLIDACSIPPLRSVISGNRGRHDVSAIECVLGGLARPGIARSALGWIVRSYFRVWGCCLFACTNVSWT